MKILKIKINDELVLIEYKKRSSAEQGGYNKFTIESKEIPAPEFKLNLQELGIFVPMMYDLPTEYAEGMVVLGVTFNYRGDDEIMGATVSAKKSVSLSNSSALFHTPFTLSSSGSDRPLPDSKFLPVAMVEILEKLQDNAKDFINGERAQIEMFAGEAK